LFFGENMSTICIQSISVVDEHYFATIKTDNGHIISQLLPVSHYTLILEELGTRGRERLCPSRLEEVSFERAMMVKGDDGTFVIYGEQWIVEFRPPTASLAGSIASALAEAWSTAAAILARDAHGIYEVHTADDFCKHMCEPRELCFVPAKGVQDFVTHFSWEGKFMELGNCHASLAGLYSELQSEVNLLVSTGRFEVRAPATILVVPQVSMQLKVVILAEVRDPHSRKLFVGPFCFDAAVLGSWMSASNFVTSCGGILYLEGVKHPVILVQSLADAREYVTTQARDKSMFRKRRGIEMVLDAVSTAEDPELVSEFLSACKQSDEKELLTLAARVGVTNDPASNFRQNVFAAVLSRAGGIMESYSECAWDI
jgi:hypothetical protein